MQIPLLDLLSFSFSLLIAAFWGILVIRKNLIVILIALELMLLSISFNFLVFSIHLDDIFGQISALLVLAVAGSESAVGLAILVAYYRLKSDISVDIISSLKG